MNEKNHKDELKVEWIGVDGALVLLYIVLSILYGYSIINRVDFVIGIVAPGISIIMTIIVFIRYCMELFSFSSNGEPMESDKED